MAKAIPKDSRKLIHAEELEIGDTFLPSSRSTVHLRIHEIVKGDTTIEVKCGFTTRTFYATDLVILTSRDGFSVSP